MDRRYTRYLTTVVLVATMLLRSHVMAAAPKVLPGSCKKVSPETCEVWLAMGPGINLGGIFEAPKEGDWGVRYQSFYVDEIARHFRTVRIPVRWSNNAAADARAQIDDYFLEKIASVVDVFLDKDMTVILDFHNYSQLTGRSLYRGEFAVDDSVVEQRFFNIWSQIARRFSSRSNKLVFEIYNEPFGTLSGARWDRIQRAALDRIRMIDKKRIVSLTVDRWSNASQLDTLNLPDDPNIMVTFHHYEPFEFTHQGAGWVGRPMKTGIACCDALQLDKMKAAFVSARKFSTQNGVPIWMGEFGAHNVADPISRARYMREITRIARDYDIPWTYWEFGSIFGIYDIKARKWDQYLLDALIRP